MSVRSPEVQELIQKALNEDGAGRDITTQALFPEGVPAEGEIIAGQDLLVAGLDVAREVFAILDQDVRWEACVEEGEKITGRTRMARLRGDGRSLLSGERVALNFLQRMSGVATLTARYVERIKGYRAKILDTRKTTPGWRLLEKHAVRVGGGANHRLNLSDGILIKDNHSALTGGILNAVRRAHERASHTMKIEVEVRSVSEVEEALSAGADIILLDNMSPEDVRKSVTLVRGRTVIEASGGITLETVEEYAAAGVDFISVGALTHSAAAVDISMDIRKG